MLADVRAAWKDGLEQIASAYIALKNQLNSHVRNKCVGKYFIPTFALVRQSNSR
jgi:hypothetical protein